MQLNRRQTILGLAATGTVWMIGGRVSAQGLLAGRAFGSTWRVILERQDTDQSPLRRMIERIIADIDVAMSPFRPGSGMTRFNRTRTTDWQPLPDTMMPVAKQALRIAALTGGAFDPTIGPLVGRYGFGPITGDLGRYDEISVRDGAARKDNPGLTLDFCGIAKGYALDQIAAALVRHGETGALIEVGGEVITLGAHPGGRPWQVAVLDPASARPAIQRIVAPGRLALATSGHSENGLRGPIEISHIINPAEGRTAPMNINSVTVLAETGMQADALATALCALGAEDGILMAEKLGLSALFIIDGVRAPREVMTGAFADHVIA